MLTRIISGGQTGADRAALDACLELGFPCGGYCPAGRRAEDGVIDRAYPLAELPGAGYPARTRRNVQASDGTAIFYEGEVTGGTELTLMYCMRERRPYKLVDIELCEPEAAVPAMQHFLARHAVATLNVAGPRASGCPRMHAFVHAHVRGLLQALQALQGR